MDIFEQQVAHREDDEGGGCRVGPSGQRQEEAARLGSSQIVPQIASAGVADLFHTRLHSYYEAHTVLILLLLLEILIHQKEVHLDSGHLSLIAYFVSLADSPRLHGPQVDNPARHLHLLHAKLLPLFYHLSILYYHTPSIQIHSSPITPSQVIIQVHSPDL